MNKFVELTQALLEGAVEMSDSAKQSFAEITRQFIEFRTTISSKYHDQLAASEKLIQNLREELKRHFDKVRAIGFDGEGVVSFALCLILFMLRI